MTPRIDPAKDGRVAWLIGLLESHNGSMRAAEIRELARARGIAMRTLDRVRERAGVSTRKTGFKAGEGWIYSLGYDPTVRRSRHNGVNDGENRDDAETSSGDGENENDDGWSLVPAGQSWGDCERCGARVRTLWFGAPRCRPACVDADDSHREPRRIR
jgi:hypothetical protein